MKTVLVFGLLFLVTFAVLSCGIHFSVGNGSDTGTVGDENSQRLQEAASYIENRYDARVGLVSESEDNGSNVPDHTPCYRTFWVCDDNLWASQALKPFDLAMAENISETAARYTSECGNSDLFEVVLGSVIPTTIHAHTDLSVDSFIFGGLNYTVWADRHQPQDGGIFFDADQYADLCFYLSLDYALLRNKVASEQWFRTGESYWNGYGFLDAAANKTGLYQNYKLGLYLFTVKATGFTSSIYDAVENVAWSYQEANGGIAAESYLKGTMYGTANVETTSILLLAYTDEALARFGYMNGLMIGAYYYAWYGIASNEHWDQGVKYTPLLGRYNSGDPTVADEQILLAKQHGIDFFAVSWIGEGNWTPPGQDFSYVDQNLANGLLRAPALEDFNFCLFYETKIVLDEVNTLIKKGTFVNFTDVFIADLKYAASQYFSNPRYLQVDGDPVLFIYNVPYLYQNFSEQEVHSLFDAARQQLAELGISPYIVGDMNGGPQSPAADSPLLYSMNATTSYFFSDPGIGWDSVLQDAETYYPQWLSNMTNAGRVFIPDAYPGFDNTENCEYKNANNIPSNNGTVLLLNETMFKQMLDIAVNYSDNNPKIVMITSWNEWLESTAIEPSVEYGDVFLDQVLYPVVSEFSSTALVSSFLLAIVLLAVAYRKKPHFRRLEKTQI